MSAGRDLTPIIWATAFRCSRRRLRMGQARAKWLSRLRVPLSTTLMQLFTYAAKHGLLRRIN